MSLVYMDGPSLNLLKQQHDAADEDPHIIVIR
jgi:hypothetical protein